MISLTAQLQSMPWFHCCWKIHAMENLLIFFQIKFCGTHLMKSSLVNSSPRSVATIVSLDGWWFCPCWTSGVRLVDFFLVTRQDQATQQIHVLTLDLLEVLQGRRQVKWRWSVDGRMSGRQQQERMHATERQWWRSEQSWRLQQCKSVSQRASC